MGILLLVAFIGVPLIEIAVFIEIGGQIGLGATLVLIVLTAVLGTWQLRAQGLATLNRARGQLERGVLPAYELFDGLCLLVAGALLLTPGFVTDALGLLLFLPPFRAALRGALGRYLRAHAQTRVGVDDREAPGSGPRPPRGPGSVIDGDYRDVTEDGGARDLGEEDRRLPR